MMRTRRPSRPAPPPKTPTAKRLEEVRAHSGHASLRGFWQQVVDGWQNKDGSPGVSYEAVRGYHYDRDAPAAYFARVARVFGFRLEYLITGEEPPTDAEQRARVSVREDPITAVLFDERLYEDVATEARTIEVFGRWHAQNEQISQRQGLPVPTPNESAQEFFNMLRYPIRRWLGPGSWVTQMHADRQRAYHDAILLALSLATPDGRDFAVRPRTPEEEAEIEEELIAAGLLGDPDEDGIRPWVQPLANEED